MSDEPEMTEEDLKAFADFLEAKDNHSRLMAVVVDERFLLDIIRGECQYRISNLPEGATLDRCYYEPSRRGLTVVIRHKSFKKVPEGCEIPMFWTEQAYKPSNEAKS